MPENRHAMQNETDVQTSITFPEPIYAHFESNDCNVIIYDVAVLLKFSVLSFLVSRHSSALNLWPRYINYRSNARQAREDFWLYGVQNNFCGSSPSLLLTPFYKSKRLANPWRNLLRPSRRQERKSRSKSASLLWKVRTRVQSVTEHIIRGGQSFTITVWSFQFVIWSFIMIPGMA